MACTRHIHAGTRGGLCAGCLLEAALTADAADPTTNLPVLESNEAGIPELTIQVPLGVSGSTSVFLATREGSPRLLRLKTWNTAAPFDFLRRFDDLRARLASLNDRAIQPPLAAAVNSAGCPSIVSEFRPGTPLLDRVRHGRLDPASGVASLESVIRATRGAHAVGLFHGSIVPGNVIFDPSSATAFLLDFGLNVLVHERRRDSTNAAADDAGFGVLIRMLREFPRSAAPTSQL